MTQNAMRLFDQALNGSGSIAQNGPRCRRGGGIDVDTYRAFAG